MNYSFHYDRLIQTRRALIRSKKDGNYYEKHHIIPTCLGGTNDPSNLVLLTAKEHYIAHLLLSQMYTDKNSRYKMACALDQMSWSNNRTKRITSASQYALIKKIIKEAEIPDEVRQKLKEARRKQVRGPLSEETKRKISEAHKGKQMSKDTKDKISSTIKGRKQSEDHIKKRTSHRKGVPGKPLTNEHKENIRLSKLGKPRSEEIKQNMKKAWERRRMRDFPHLINQNSSQV